MFASSAASMVFSGAGTSYETSSSIQLAILNLALSSISLTCLGNSDNLTQREKKAIQ
jgi:hypothetical protein